MRGMRLLTLAGMATLCGVLAASIASAAGPDGEAIAKYFRKKNNVGPSVKVNVTGIKDSSIKGAKQGTLEVGEGPSAQKSVFLVSEDGRYIVFADIEDITIDPSKAVMSKINLKDEPFKGPEAAKVTIVEYSDFQCPFCTKGYDTVENKVLKEYGDKVKFYYKNYPLPFHPWATPAAIAVVCLKQQKATDAYWTLYKGYFEKQKEITPENLKEKTAEILNGQKFDKAKFDDCFDNKKTADQVKAEMAEGSSVGVRGTPGFVINGRLLSGAQPFEKFKDVIDDELASSK